MDPFQTPNQLLPADAPHPAGRSRAAAEDDPLRALRASERDLVEDVLRALLECEHRSQPASDHQVADQLGVDLDVVRAILQRARSLDLVLEAETHWQLTSTGRDIAVRVMRAHRLVETRLARESGLRAEHWHEVAHAVEHRLSREDVNRLADHLSNPRFDPHGDPIPTREGGLPAPEGEPLLALASNAPVVITHIEDEPPALFARLAHLGVFAGERVILRASSPKGLRLEVEGREVLLPAELASLIRVRPLHTHELAASPQARRLSDLRPGRSARVLTLLPGCIGAERTRLLDLGFVPGSRIEHTLPSPLGGSAAYRVRGSLIALRRQQAEQVLIEPERV